MNKLVVSFSGGRTSAYMAYKIQTSKEFLDYEKHYVFANTGLESPETLDFVDRCSAEFGLNVTWIEAEVNQSFGVGVGYRVVAHKTAARAGEPFSDLVKKFGIPNKSAPFCSKELKSRPISKWKNENVGREAVTAMGMRADERRRAVSRAGVIYPLVTIWPTSERDVRLFWRKMPFDLQINDYMGNCDLCWKKSLRKRLTILSEHPEVAEIWRNWEDYDGEHVFDRDGLTVPQLLEMSKRPFRKAEDIQRLRDIAPELCLNFDVESACTCE